MKKIPKRLQGVLWSKSVGAYDWRADKNYIIHQILMFGELEDVKWLESFYNNDEIRNVFLNHPEKIYTPQALSFVKDYLLGLSSRKVYEQKYLVAAPRNIGF